MIKVDLPPDLPDHLKVKAAEAPSEMRRLYKSVIKLVPRQDRFRYPSFNQLTIVVETSDDDPDYLVSYFRKKDGRIFVVYDRDGTEFFPSIDCRCRDT